MKMTTRCHCNHRKLKHFAGNLNVLIICSSEMSRKTKSGSKCLDIVKGNFHWFSNKSEIVSLQQHLLDWYHSNKRQLPWRHKAADSTLDLNTKAYAVWVSEVMLQQTQVATVISYYNKWMKKWPTIHNLAEASLEEVNEAWSGLGYYSRGRRLLEGAQKVVNELSETVPRTSQELLSHLPGVGRYTANAIASIAYNEPVSVVDGNVVRVIARLRAIGADSTSQPVIDTFWSISQCLLDTANPGDFNQAMMELGATICTPKAPSCKVCPLKDYCYAFKQVEKRKVESSKGFTKTTKETLDLKCDVEDCHLCLPHHSDWQLDLGVMNYPRKSKKKPRKEEHTSVFILVTGSGGCRQYLLTQRPDKGLLAGLWEFPSLPITDSSCDMLDKMVSDFELSLPEGAEAEAVGKVVHIFSHIHQTYTVSSISVPQPMDIKFDRPYKWLTEQEVDGAALSTAMRKIFKAFMTTQKVPKAQGMKRRQSNGDGNVGTKKQSTMESFFKKKT